MQSRQAASTDASTRVRFSEAFRYHQKATLAENIASFIRDWRVTSLLDIGAGTPEMALRLSRRVERYVAVERNPEFGCRLAEAGLHVVEAEFPVSLDETFDLVLSSHSIPEGALEAYGPFLETAWNRVAPGGHLLVVTFKGSCDAGHALRTEILGQGFEDIEYPVLIATLSRFAPIDTVRVTSYAESPAAADIVRFVEDWILSGTKTSRHRAAVERIVETRYKMPDRYIFPTEHLFLSCAKPAPR